MDETLGALEPGEQQIVDSAYSTLERVRRVTVRLRASWFRLDDLPAADEASLTASLDAILETWASSHGVTSMKTDGARVEVVKAQPFMHMDI